MSNKASHPTEVDIDPGWYPGQPELEEQEPAAEPLLPSGDAAKQHSVLRFGDAMFGSPGIPASVPTVLTKLQKWGDYESVGSQVLPTKFIPMKTPLSAEILDSWSLPSQPKHRLTVPEMIAQQAALGRKVGLLLDLSNHDCLYTDDIPPGLAYRHVQLVAKELPPPEFVNAVVAVANMFWEKHPDEYIAVHCAYGFNRTGFVVCCYLVECCGLNVEDALAAFAESRPPGVKHEQFRSELHRRYGNVMHGMVPHGVYGSPDDNSSFGYSPSCGSLDMRDLIVGGGGGAGSGSPIPGLTRGSTFDCLLGAHHHALVATASGGGSSSSPGVAHRHSMDGHQTLTFTMSSFTAAEFRRGSSSGFKPLAAAAGTVPAARVQVHPHLHHQHQPHSSPQLPPCVALPPVQVHKAQVAWQHQQQLAGGHAALQEEEQQQQRESRQSQEGDESRESQGGKNASQQQQRCQLEDYRRQANSVGRGQHGSESRRQDGKGRGNGVLGSGVAAEPSMSSLAEAAGGPVSAEGVRDSVRNRAGSQQQLQSCCGGGSGGVDNESLGVNDRAVLLALRQQAMAQLSGKTIPEESGSSHSTPCGCSSMSPADCDSTAGYCTPRQGQEGRYSYKSLDAIDWGAAATAEEIGGVDGDGTGTPVPAFEALRLG